MKQLDACRRLQCRAQFHQALRHLREIHRHQKTLVRLCRRFAHHQHRPPAYAQHAHGGVGAEPGGQPPQRSGAPHHQVGIGGFAGHIRRREVHAGCGLHCDVVPLLELQRMLREAHGRIRWRRLVGVGQVHQLQRGAVLGTQQRSAGDGVAAFGRKVGDGEDGAKGHGGRVLVVVVMGPCAPVQRRPPDVALA